MLGTDSCRNQMAELRGREVEHRPRGRQLKNVKAYKNQPFMLMRLGFTSLGLLKDKLIGAT